jgi:hypothetical protein
MATGGSHATVGRLGAESIGILIGGRSAEVSSGLGPRCPRPGATHQPNRRSAFWPLKHIHVYDAEPPVECCAALAAASTYVGSPAESALSKRRNRACLQADPGMARPGLERGHHDFQRLAAGPHRLEKTCKPPEVSLGTSRDDAVGCAWFSAGSGLRETSRVPRVGAGACGPRAARSRHRAPAARGNQVDARAGGSGGTLLGALTRWRRW